MLVQQAVNAILSKIYEPLFLPCSHGFRPDRNCHTALQALYRSTYEMKDGAIVEIDIRKYFNSIPHGPLIEFLREKISDDRFLRLIKVLVSAPTIQDGKITENKIGSPRLISVDRHLQQKGSKIYVS